MHSYYYLYATNMNMNKSLWAKWIEKLVFNLQNALATNIYIGLYCLPQLYFKFSVSKPLVDRPTKDTYDFTQTVPSDSTNPWVIAVPQNITKTGVAYVGISLAGNAKCGLIFISLLCTLINKI